MKENMRIYYDEEGDYLDIFIGKPRDNYGDHVNNDTVLFRDEKTDKVIGIGIFNFKRHTKDLKDIELNLPISIKFEELDAKSKITEVKQIS